MLAQGYSLAIVVSSIEINAFCQGFYSPLKLKVPLPIFSPLSI